MHTDAVFGIGSITRQFTAAAILQLHDQGKLGLGDDVTKWLPDFATGGARLPLRRLLDHTSGISSVPELTRLRFDPAQHLPWVEGLTFSQGGVLLTFRRANGGAGPVTELRYDTGTEHSILRRS